MTIIDQIAALPAWPDETYFVDTDDNRSGTYDREGWLEADRAAALARLELAREFIASGNPSPDCNCAWCANALALLAALEVPR